MSSSSNKAQPKSIVCLEEAMQTACQSVPEQRKGLQEAGQPQAVPTPNLKVLLKGIKPIHKPIHKMSKPSIKPRPKNLVYSEEAMQAACQSVLEERKGLREAARLHGVPPSTLKDRLQGRKAFHEVSRTVLTASEEEQLADWIKEAARRGSSYKICHIQQAVQSILNERKAVTVFKDNVPGRKWVSLFLRRHTDVTLGAQQAANTEGKLRVWFETATRDIQAAAGDVLDHPSRIFSYAETGFQLGGSRFSKVLANKGDSCRYRVSKDTKTQVIFLICGSALGEVHKPLVFFPGQRLSRYPLGGFLEARFIRSNIRCIGGNIFTAWLKDTFVPAIEHVPKPVLLLGDNKTHFTLTVSEFCRDHGIFLYQLPSHSDHMVQPLDLTNFKLLKQVWREEVVKFREENSNTVTVRKGEFLAVFKKAWKRGIQKDAVISGFRTAGLYPWNPDHEDMMKLSPYATTETETYIEKVTADESNVDEDLYVNPPSPIAYPSALPLPSLSPLPSCVTNSVSSSSSSYHVASSPTIATVSSSSSSCITSTPIMATVATSSSSSSLIDSASTKEALDRLLDLTAKVGFDGLIRYRTHQALGVETVDPEEQLFSLLYSRLTRPSQTDTDNSGCVVEGQYSKLTRPSQTDTDNSGCVVEGQYSKLTRPSQTDTDNSGCVGEGQYLRLTRPSQTDTDNSGCVVEGHICDSLPHPSSSTQNKSQTLQPPETISSDTSRQFVTDMDPKKRRMEKDEESNEEEKRRKKKKKRKKAGFTNSGQGGDMKILMTFSLNRNDKSC